MSIAKTMSIPSVDLFFVVSDEDWGLAKAIIKKEIDQNQKISIGISKKSQKKCGFINAVSFIFSC